MRLQTHGGNLRNFLASQQEEREQLEHLRHNTERRLLLRKLSLDPKVSRPRLRSACLRLTKVYRPRNLAGAASVNFNFCPVSVIVLLLKICKDASF